MGAASSLPCIECLGSEHNRRWATKTIHDCWNTPLTGSDWSWAEMNSANLCGSIFRRPSGECLSGRRPAAAAAAAASSRPPAAAPSDEHTPGQHNDSTLTRIEDRRLMQELLHPRHCLRCIRERRKTASQESDMSAPIDLKSTDVTEQTSWRITRQASSVTCRKPSGSWIQLSIKLDATNLSAPPPV